MDPNPRDSVHVKIGTAEFQTDGSPEDVKARYEAFLELLKTLPVLQTQEPKTPVRTGTANAAPAVPRTENGGAEIPREIMDRVFRASDGVVSLLALPRGDTSVPDACLMLLYGFATLLSIPAITGVTLMEACRQSGVAVDRLGRVLDAQTDYVNSGGTRRGKRYSLNNPGQRRAMELITGLV
jgi:hypothetical protein